VEETSVRGDTHTTDTQKHTHTHTHTQKHTRTRPLTWMVGGERCLRVVVVERVVVVSMKVVDISGGAEVVRAAPRPTGTSPTSRTLPFTRTLAWPSAAMLSTFRPL